MVFPGVLRGRPEPRLATTPTSRPRRSLSSPGVTPNIVARACRPVQPRVHGLENEIDADPSRFEDLCPARPGGLAVLGWQGLTPRWPRSLRLSSASGMNLGGPEGGCKGVAANDRASC